MGPVDNNFMDDTPFMSNKLPYPQLHLECYRRTDGRIRHGIRNVNE
jgi:hypothetical protein